MIRRLSLIAIAATTLAATAALSQTSPDVVYLSKDCAAAGHSLGVDCFETVNTLLDHIWPATGPRPSATDPLLVEVGVGEFSGILACPAGEGWVTFRGAGRDRSKIVDGAIAVLATDCQKLGFQDLTLESGTWGVVWTGGGTSSWTDIDIEAGFAAWYDVGCPGQPTDPPVGEHYFWGARLVAEDLAYFSECGQTWLYGSELFTRPIGNSAAATGVNVAFRGDVRLFGSTVRVVTKDATSVGQVIGVNVGTNINGIPQGYGEFHMHGGIISLDASNLQGIGVTSLAVNSLGVGDAFAHTPDTAFAILPATGGSVARLSGDGKILSPFLWQPASDVPVAGLQSLTGQDLFVEIDCDATGDCSGSGTPPLQPHLMVYNETCPSDWFDTVLGDCRP